MVLIRKFHLKLRVISCRTGTEFKGIFKKCVILREIATNITLEPFPFRLSMFSILIYPCLLSTSTHNGPNKQKRTLFPKLRDTMTNSFREAYFLKPSSSVIPEINGEYRFVADRQTSSPRSLI